MNVSTADFEPSSSLTEKHIEGYFIEELIGIGGFADVYSARRDFNDYGTSSPSVSDPRRDRRQTNFAIKFLRKGICLPEIISRFEAERRLLDQFTHTGIVRDFESGLTDDDRPYFVMEEVEASLFLEKPLWL